MSATLRAPLISRSSFDNLKVDKEHWQEGVRLANIVAPAGRVRLHVRPCRACSFTIRGHRCKMRGAISFVGRGSFDVHGPHRINQLNN